MTTLLEQALEAAHRLPTATQDDIACVVLRLAGADEEARRCFGPAEKSAVGASKTAAALGEFATDEEVRAVCAKHDL